MARPTRALALCALLVLPTPALSQGSGSPAALTVEGIMRGTDLVGTAPSTVRFSADGRAVYFRWRNPGADTLDQDYRAAVAGGA